MPVPENDRHADLVAGQEVVRDGVADAEHPHADVVAQVLGHVGVGADRVAPDAVVVAEHRDAAEAVGGDHVAVLGRAPADDVVVARDLDAVGGVAGGGAGLVEAEVVALDAVAVAVDDPDRVARLPGRDARGVDRQAADDAVVGRELEPGALLVASIATWITAWSVAVGAVLPGSLYPSIVTGSVIAGSGLLTGVIVCGPAPGILNPIVSCPGWPLASLIRLRSESAPLLLVLRTM